uniref:Uncharacterized protein n=1 Tax=Solanum tuberosum TaxID=4113 RepID=M1DXG4_SOLTU
MVITKSLWCAEWPPSCLNSSVPSPKGQNQFDERKEQSACHLVVPRCSVGSPKLTEVEEVEGQSKKAKKLTKGRIADLIGEPDLLHRMALRSIFLATINTFSNINL